MMTASRERTICIVAFALCLLANLWYSSLGWKHNLHELHEFRQIQTALTARSIQQDGWSLAYPTPLFGPPWSVPLEFPIYQVSVAHFSTLTGMPLERAGRLVSLFFFYLALPAFFLLLRQLQVPPPRRWLFLALLLVTPVYLHYSRTFMIESTALCASAWFLHAFLRSLESRRPSWIASALFLGSLAALAKITTFLVFLVPAAAATVIQLRELKRTSLTSWRPLLKLSAIALGIAGVSLLIGLAWVLYGDAVKMTNPLSRSLVSSQMHDWNYGTLALRLDPNYWRELYQHSTPGVSRLGTLLVLLASLFFVGRTARAQILLLVAFYFVAPLVFSNLYFLHDYYFYANAVFVVTAIAVLWNRLLDTTWLPRPATYTVIGVMLVAQLTGFTSTYFHVQNRGDEAPPELGIALGKLTAPGDVLLIYGLEWNPVLPYVAGRKAILVTALNEPHLEDQEEVFRKLPDGSVTAVVLAGSSRNNHSLREWLVRRFDLVPDPLLHDEKANVFVSQKGLGYAVPRLEHAIFTRLQLNRPPDAEMNGVKLHRYRVTDLPDPVVVSMFTPRPLEILAPFGISTARVDGGEGFHAHAPTVITVPLPVGSRRLKAGYGLAPETFAGQHHTDGVLFEIKLVNPSGETTVLFERFLEPAGHPADRGKHELLLELPSTASGQLVFSTLPGPANNITFDWAYWTAVEVR